MGKYDQVLHDIESSDLSTELEVMYLIANELAEANRLKRIEILEFAIDVDHTDEEIQKDLKDQA